MEKISRRTFLKASAVGLGVALGWELSKRKIEYPIDTIAIASPLESVVADLSERMSEWMQAGTLTSFNLHVGEQYQISLNSGYQYVYPEVKNSEERLVGGAPTVIPTVDIRTNIPTKKKDIHPLSRIIFDHARLNTDPHMSGFQTVSVNKDQFWDTVRNTLSAKELQNMFLRKDNWDITVWNEAYLPKWYTQRKEWKKAYNQVLDTLYRAAPFMLNFNEWAGDPADSHRPSIREWQEQIKLLEQLSPDYYLYTMHIVIRDGEFTVSPSGLFTYSLPSNENHFHNVSTDTREIEHYQLSFRPIDGIIQLSRSTNSETLYESEIAENVSHAVGSRPSGPLQKITADFTSFILTDATFPAIHPFRDSVNL